MLYNDFAKNFGIRIKYFRLLRGMTQETLSDKIAMSTRYVRMKKSAFSIPLSAAAF